MKIAILLGRGIEGCGVTRFATELQRYIQKQNLQCTVYASSDKKWDRRQLQKTDIIEFTNKEIESIRKEINKVDILFYQSLPSKAHSEEYKDLFYDKLVVGITNPIKIIFQNDHHIISLNRNSKLWETVENVDLALTFGPGTAFARKLKEQNIYTPIKYFNNGHDFTKLDYLWKKEQIKKLSYLGRFATFKEPKRLIYYQPMLAAHGIYTEARGIEKSIGAKVGFFGKGGHDMTQGDYENIMYRRINVFDEQDINYLNVYGPYDRIPTLDNLSNNMFGANFFNLPINQYANIIEYTTLEMVNVGMIVLVDKEWAENNIHIEGDNFYDLNCFVYSDRNNPQETIDQMLELVGNKELREKKRKLAYDICKSHCDINVTFNNLLNIAFNSKKNIFTKSTLF